MDKIHKQYITNTMCISLQGEEWVSVCCMIYKMSLRLKVWVLLVWRIISGRVFQNLAAVIGVGLVPWTATLSFNVLLPNDVAVPWKGQNWCPSCYPSYSVKVLSLKAPVIKNITQIILCMKDTTFHSVTFLHSDTKIIFLRIQKLHELKGYRQRHIIGSW